MNYGEDLTYWYLRLNGFFPISNFVVHRSGGVEHTSDVDVLAVRPPYVYEPIGGQRDDWDVYLSQNLPFERFIGLVCEVKTGAFEEEKLFRPEHLRYTLWRLGLTDRDNTERAAEALKVSSSTAAQDGIVLAKFFVSPKEHVAGPYLNRTVSQLEDFLADRVRRYPIDKYASRMFFPSKMFQLIITQVYRAIEKR